MIKHTISHNWSSSGALIPTSFDILGGAENNLDEVIPHGSADLNILFAQNVAQLKELFILSDQDILIKTNNSGSPVNVFTQKAGVPFIWTSPSAGLRDTAGTAVTVNITSLYVTNAGAVDANLQLRSLSDPTP